MLTIFWFHSLFGSITFRQLTNFTLPKLVWGGAARDSVAGEGRPHCYRGD
jgi:hypothetical protein